MFATPIAYLINKNGVIAADVAVGVEPILALLSRLVPAKRDRSGRRCTCRKLISECGCVNAQGALRQ
jgi:hypothetical protein